MKEELTRVLKGILFYVSIVYMVLTVMALESLFEMGFLGFCLIAVAFLFLLYDIFLVKPEDVESVTPKFLR